MSPKSPPTPDPVPDPNQGGHVAYPREPGAPRLTRPALLDTGMSPLLGIVITVFLDILSFGIFIPDLQLRVRGFGIEGWQLGAVQGLYSFAALLCAPILGRLSDAGSRRRVLLVTSSVATISYMVYGHGTILGLIIVSRVLSGIASASMGVGFAYMADITTVKDRAKSMGLLGAALGLGFVFGPVLGTYLLWVGKGDPLLLGSIGAVLSLINFLYILLWLPDPIPHELSDAERQGPWRTLFAAMRNPSLRILFIISFTVQFGFTNLETTFFQLLNSPRSVFHILNVEQAKIMGGEVLGVIVILGILFQGGLVRVLMRRMKEVVILRFSYLCATPALALVPYFPLWWPGIIVMFFLSLGTSLAQPCMSSLISQEAPVELQGGIFGVTTALASLARLVSPLVSNTLFVKDPTYPYLFGAAVMLLPMIGVWRVRQPTGAIVHDKTPVHA